MSYFLQFTEPSAVTETVVISLLQLSLSGTTFSAYYSTENITYSTFKLISCISKLSNLKSCSAHHHCNNINNSTQRTRAVWKCIIYFYLF